MSPQPENVTRYLEKYGAQGAWKISGADRSNFSGAVVIPSLAEGESLFATLQSLAGNPTDFYKDFVIIVVVNHAEGAAPDIVRQNEKDLARIAENSKCSPLNLAWVDAASPEFMPPARKAGVGFARKLGMDRALSVLDWSSDPILVCLDADTLVEDNYLQTILGHFARSRLGAAVLPFRHQSAASREQNEAILRYELFLRSYVYGLRLAGSPYAFNSVGSAMACRGAAYVRCGGMNTRKAGEDFYFLQKLAKIDGVDRLTGTTVHPSPRASERVPFGTGRSVSRMMVDDFQGVLIYPVAVFQVLGQWLDLVASSLGENAKALLSSAADISPILSGYLEQLEWLKVWPSLQENNSDESSLLKAFHDWFDGFRSLRLIHLLCDNSFLRGESEVLLPDYFALEGVKCPETIDEMLEKLRSDDSGL